MNEDYINNLIKNEQFRKAKKILKRKISESAAAEKYTYLMQMSQIYSIQLESSKRYEKKYIECLKEAIQAFKETPEPYFQLGLFYSMKDNPNKAIEYLMESTQKFYSITKVIISEKGVNDFLETSYYKNYTTYLLTSTATLAKLKFDFGEIESAKNIILLTLNLLKENPQLIKIEHTLSLYILTTIIGLYSLTDMDFLSFKEYTQSNTFIFYRPKIENEKGYEFFSKLVTGIETLPSEAFTYTNPNSLSSWRRKQMHIISDVKNYQDVKNIWIDYNRDPFTLELQKGLNELKKFIDEYFIEENTKAENEFKSLNQNKETDIENIDESLLSDEVKKLV